MKLRSKVLNILIALAVAVTFIPVTGQFAYAEGENVDGDSTAAETPAAGEPVTAAAQTPAFDTKGQVKGLKIKSRTYKSVQIGWNSYAQAKGYEIYRADKKNGTYKKIKTLTACQYNDTGNKKLGKYKYYKVRAYSTQNGKNVYSKYSSILSAKPKLPKPKNVTTTGKTGAVKISWSGVTGAKKYQVYRAPTKNGKYKKIKTTKSKSYTDSSVYTGYRYFYKVRAYRKVSKKKKYSDFSSSVEGMALLGNVGNLNVSINSSGTVTASWASKKGAYGYQLQRKRSGGSYYTVATTRDLSKKDSLTESGTYVYRVRAYAYVNGKRQYGPYSATGGRANALAKAQSWVGCKESNGSHKKIIDVYNSYNPASGKIGYGTPWCAAFVSAVAISTGNTEVIPVHSYCPTMLARFTDKTYDRKYTPRGADVVFFDWNKNRVPDHVGMVEKTDGDNVTTIEGNYSDAVKRRTFKKGYSLLLAYGLPNYTVRNTISYTAPSKSASAASEDRVNLACLEITEALQTGSEDFAGEEPAAENPAPAEAAGTEAVTEAPEEGEAAEAAEPAAKAPEEPTEMETAETIVDYIQETAPAEEADVAPAEESTFNAFLAYEICDEMNIEACVVTIEDQDGTEHSYNEVVLDGELYILDATEEGGVLEKYTPEEIN